MSDDPTLAAIEQREQAASAPGAGDGAVFESWLDVPYLLDRLRAVTAERDEARRQVADAQALCASWPYDNRVQVILRALDSANPQEKPKPRLLIEPMSDAIVASWRPPLPADHLCQCSPCSHDDSPATVQDNR